MDYTHKSRRQFLLIGLAVHEYLYQSRITKALTDGSELNFLEAEARLDAVRLAIVVDDVACSTPAGQACLITMLATSRRTFRDVTIVAAGDVVLRRPLPRAKTLFDFAKILDVSVKNNLSFDITHVISTGPNPALAAPFSIRCWWNGWLGGVLPNWDLASPGEGWNPLAGAFSGALAVREVFANVRGAKAMQLHGNVISLWEPWSTAMQAESGPSNVHLARSITIVGLGHLGQGILWNLGLLPAHGELLVLQDYQDAGPENVATGLLTSFEDIGRRKARIAADWCEFFGWKTALVERKFIEGTKAGQDDPSIVLSALDKPEPRRHILAAGFHRMFDIGVGHGPNDFEIGQFRSFDAGDPSTWMHSTEHSNTDARMCRKAYSTMKDQCGAFTLASASVAVPFVGAAMGALCTAQLLRAGAMKGIPKIFQFEMSSPEMGSRGRLSEEAVAGFGSVSIDLKSAA